MDSTVTFARVVDTILPFGRTVADASTDTLPVVELTTWPVTCISPVATTVTSPIVEVKGRPVTAIGVTASTVTDATTVDMGRPVTDREAVPETTESPITISMSGSADASIATCPPAVTA